MPAAAQRMEEEVEGNDSDFVAVRISEFYSPKVVAFSLHLKLAAGKYLRIFRAGENYDEAELRAYEADRGMRYVYFARAHRAGYVTSSASLLKKMAPIPAIPLRTKFGVARILSELYLQELFAYTPETLPTLVEQGKEITTLLAAWIEGEAGLEKLLLTLDQVDLNVESLAFLTGTFACVASKRFPWKSRRTMETLLQAAFFCDVGLAELAPEIRRLRPKRMNEEQRREYQRHPEISVGLLRATGAVPENLLTIVREHHEYCDGSGFPQQLNATKLLLLSKFMLMSADLVRTSAEYLLPPIEASKVLFPDHSDRIFTVHPELAAKYDRELLLPFFAIFGKEAST